MLLCSGYKVHPVHSETSLFRTTNLRNHFSEIKGNAIAEVGGSHQATQKQVHDSRQKWAALEADLHFSKQ